VVLHPDGSPSEFEVGANLEWGNPTASAISQPENGVALVVDGQPALP
jgi:hypothetical protein